MSAGAVPAGRPATVPGSDRPNPWQRHDVVVVLAALALFAAGGLTHRTLTEPSSTRFDKLGLAFQRPVPTLPVTVVPPAPLRLGADLVGRDEPPPAWLPDPIADAGEFPYHVVFTSPESPLVRVEVRITERPAYSNLRGALAFDRRSRYGELYRALATEHREIGRHDWLETAFRYAYKPGRDAAPVVATAIEYATVNGNYLYAVTVHGGRDRDVHQLARVVAPTLTVDSTFPGAAATTPLVPIGKSRGPRREPPVHVAQALSASVMVVAVDLVGEHFVPVAGGSGTIVTPDGSILTNFHVIHDEQRDRLHDLFAIARFRGSDREPRFECAGRPSRSKFIAELDLALLKCDIDMDGHAFSPQSWPTVPRGRNDPILPSETIWVIGYPDLGGGRVTFNSGEVEGLTGETGGSGTDFIKTNAPITSGNSGGTAIDIDGNFIGVPTAFRVRSRRTKYAVQTVGQVGLLRPLSAAAPLLAIADQGWVPTEGDSSIDAAGEGRASAPAAPDGVFVSSRVVDVANDRPVAGATVVVFRPGLRASAIDLDRLDEQALVWAQTNEAGEFEMSVGVPRGRAYAVAVIARGYSTLAQDGALVVPEEAPERWDPWGVIRIERR